MTEEKLQALSDYENSPVFAAEELAVLRNADALTTTPVDVSDDVFAAVRAIYDDVQIVELTSAACLGELSGAFRSCLEDRGGGFLGRSVLSIADPPRRDCLE